jgi:hypothetical protein
MGERESIPLPPPHGASPYAPDGQPSSPTGGQHPSDLRRREHEAQPTPIHHPAAEPHDPAATAREHAERLRRHGAK